MNERIRTRPFQPTDADHEAVARLHASVPPHERLDFEPRTAAELRAFDAVFARRGQILRRHVAQEVATGRVVAEAHFFHTPWSHRPDRFWLSVRCDPAFQRLGVGGRLHAEAMRELASLGAAEVRTMARETQPDLVEIVQRHGYHETLRSWGFVLELGGSGGKAAPAPAEVAGVEIAPLPHVQATDPAWLDKLRTLYIEVNRDVPLPNHPDPEPSPQELAEYLDRGAQSLPEACFIARDRGRHVGLAVMHRSEDDPGALDHLITGVDRAYRGRGVARALKLRTIAFAQRRGFARIRTGVESNNPGMLALNDQLGFQRSGGVILFERRIAG